MNNTCIQNGGGGKNYKNLLEILKLKITLNLTNTTDNYYEIISQI